MGHLLVQRLALIRIEYNTAQAALRFVEESWISLVADKHPALSGVPLRDIRLTRTGLERTYQTRLFSEFERILKQYLQGRREKVPGKAEQLIDKVIKVTARQKIDIPTEVSVLVHQVRDYRNDFVHSGTPNIPPVTFGDALSALNKFVSKLPDP